MASNDTLATFKPQDAIPPAANHAQPDLRNVHPVLAFDPTTDETVYFEGVLPRHYAGGGITARIAWMAATATSGSCRWEVAVERHDDEGTDLDADSFAAAQSAGGTAPATTGMVQYTDIAFTSGAQMDSLAAGESFRLLVRRDADGTTGTDDMTGDSQLLAVEIRES